MALKLESLKAFLGFGDGNRNDEYYFSSGMRYKRGAIEPGWSVVENASSSSVSGGMTLMTAFGERSEGAGAIVYGCDDTGDILKSTAGSTWSRVHVPGTSNSGNGLVVDHSSSQRVLYIQDRYVGSYDGTVWYDTFMDLSWTTTNPKDADIYEDWVVIANSSTIALLNITDDSMNNSAFTLPPDFVIKSVKSGRNGILIGANFNNRGMLALWDAGTDRSLAPWIWTNGNIRGIAKYKGIWVVSTGREIILTDGYQILDSYKPPDLLDSTVNIGPKLPTGIVVEEDKLFITSGRGRPNRGKNGVFILDLATRLWEYCPVSTNNTWLPTTSLNMGAIFISSGGTGNWRYVSYEDVVLTPDQQYVGLIYDTAGSSYFISSVAGDSTNSKKKAEAIIVDFDFAMMEFKVFADPDWKITLKLYDFSRQLWGYALTKVAGSVTTQVTVDGTIPTYNVAEVGDELTISQGLNAGSVRHITVVDSAGSDTEVWTLDEPLNNLMESSMNMTVSPFKKVGTKVVSGKALIKDNRFYMPVKNSIIGRKFMIKTYIEATAMRPRIKNISLLYNELTQQ